MAVNKVIVDDEILIDLTQDTVTPEDVRKGVTFHTNDGNSAIGNYEIEQTEESSNFIVRNIGLVNKVVHIGDVLLDLTQDTITPYDVMEGKTFHMRNGEYMTGTYIPDYGSLIEMSSRYNWADYMKYCRSSFNESSSTNQLEITQLGTFQDKYGDAATSTVNLEYNIFNRDKSIFKKGSVLTLTGSITVEDEIPSGCYYKSYASIIERKLGSTNSIGGSVIFSEVERESNINNKKFIYTIGRDCDYLVLSICYDRRFYKKYTFISYMFGDITMKFQNIAIDNYIVRKNNYIIYPQDFYKMVLNGVYEKHNISKEEYPYYVIASSNGMGHRYVFVSKTQKHPYYVESVTEGSRRDSRIYIDNDMIAYEYSFTSPFIDDMVYSSIIQDTAIEINVNYYERNNYELVYAQENIVEDCWLIIPTNPIE